MPKRKTHSGAAKRLKVKSRRLLGKTGNLKRRSAYRNHILTKKSQKQKVGLRTPSPRVAKADLSMIKRLLCLR